MPISAIIACMSIPVGTGRIWTPGGGNTSIPFFAPNYWKQPHIAPLIDPNPYHQPVAAPPTAAPVTYDTKQQPPPSKAHRRVAKLVLFAAAAAVAASIGAAAWRHHAPPHAPPAPQHWQR